MVGEFTASVIADLKKEPVLEDSLRSGILRLIRQGMINDIFIGGNISKESTPVVPRLRVTVSLYSILAQATRQS
jgi:hypothetical protein